MLTGRGLTRTPGSENFVFKLCFLAVLLFDVEISKLVMNLYWLVTNHVDLT